MSQYCNSYDTLISDIGGVLFTSKDGQTTNVDAHMFRQIIGTRSWYNLDTGKISNNEAYSLIPKQFPCAKATSGMRSRMQSRSTVLFAAERCSIL
ncbi:hypothetical protein CVT25_000778 [Psilocybe cyanescens]|uniref:Uncharacterized protein n=1 Tax=Psilocybe cyanescens TaxID=93625 RepID=A0A409XAW8_PSICY|nr:hypothetical protein CVT25_000778 [Psilocybe cyanescens]